MTLTNSQRAFIESTAPLVVGLAGPGGGKSLCLCERIRHIIARGADPARILAISYTNAASNVLQERLGDIQLGGNSTLHGFMLRLLTQHGALIGFTGEIAVISDEDKKVLLDQIKKEEGFKGTESDLAKQFELGPGRYFAPDISMKLARRGAERVVFRFYREMIQGGFLDYDSMLGFGSILIDQPDLPWPYEFLFVDEFQDCCPIDAKVYAAMRVKERTFIGDEDQAIFSFRGGSQRPLHVATMKASEVGALIYLEENFRCDEAVCKVANDLIRHNGNRLTRWTVSATGNPGSVEVWKCMDGIQEASRIADDLKARFRVEHAAAVLVRTNALADFYRNILQQSGIQVSEKELPILPKDWELARAALSLQICPESDWLALRYIGLAWTPNVASGAKSEAAKQGVAVNEVMSNFLGRTVKRGSDVFEALTELGVSVESRKLMERISGSAGNPLTFSASDLSRKAAEIATAYAVTPGVFVWTLHAAKGQEWDTVYMPAMEEGILPHKNSDLAEERRLAYVGKTRARHRLVLSWAAQRYDEWKGLVKCEPSRFLKEIKS